MLAADARPLIAPAEKQGHLNTPPKANTMNGTEMTYTGPSHHEEAINADSKLPAIPESVTFTLAGMNYEVKRMPWKKCRSLGVVLARIGTAMSAGQASDEKTMDDMTAAIAMATDLSPEALDEMPVEPLEIYRAFHCLLAVTGMDRFQRAEFQRLRQILKETVPEHILGQALSGVFQELGEKAGQPAN